MKVYMLKTWTWADDGINLRRAGAGDFVEVDDATAESWIDRGIASKMFEREAEAEKVEVVPAKKAERKPAAKKAKR